MTATGRRVSLVVLWGLASSCLMNPNGGGQKVTGTRDPKLDVPAVQKAVEMGGTVLLEGTFDFGGQSVTITSSVVVQGKKGDSGEYHTCIRKGFNSFTIEEGALGPDIQVKVEDLSFDGSTGSAIVVHTGHVTVRKNRIRNVAYRPTSTSKLLGAGITIGDFEQPGTIAEIIVEDNDIEINTDYDPKLHWSWGIYISPVSRSNSEQAESLSKEIRIQRNVVRDFGEGGIFAKGCEGASILVSENVIDGGSRNGYYGIAMHRDVASGLEVGPAEILSNSILNIGDKEKYLGLGIGLADARRTRIEDNKIEVSEASTGRNAGIRLTCWQNGGSGSKNNSVVGNQILGTGYYGLLLEGCGEMSLTAGNLLQNNDFSNFEAKVAIVKLGRFTGSNSFQSSSGLDTVMDCGQDNQIEGAQLVECPSASE